MDIRFPMRAFSTAGMNQVIRIDFKKNQVELDDGDIKRIDTVILMILSGKYDKNQTPIYEDDILFFKTDYKGSTGNYVVHWDGVGLVCDRSSDGNFMLHSIWNTAEIIGNIHENYELINKE